jgi:hypothetical protein
MSKIYYPYPANDGEHKNDIITKSGKTTKFDSIGYSDFTIHKDEARKQIYVDRHKKNESKYWNKSGIDTASFIFNTCTSKKSFMMLFNLSYSTPK